MSNRLWQRLVSYATLMVKYCLDLSNKPGTLDLKADLMHDLLFLIYSCIIIFSGVRLVSIPMYP